MRILKNIPYGDCERHVVDLYLPETAPKATFVYLHGGGIESGSKEGTECKRLSEDLTAAGYAAVMVNYRLYPTAKYPEFIEDGAKAAAWALEHRDEYNLGPIYLGGSSAGSYLSSMICFDRRYLEMFGAEPEDLAGYVLDAGQPTTHFNVLRERGVDPNRCIVDEASPLYHIQDARPNRPLLILYADMDMPCRPEQNKLMIATLRHMGYDESLVRVCEMNGYKHCQYDFVDDENGKNLLAKEIIAFMDR